MGADIAALEEKFAKARQFDERTAHREDTVDMKGQHRKLN